MHFKGQHRCRASYQAETASIYDESSRYLITAPKGCVLNHHLLTQGAAGPALELRVSAGDLRMKGKGFG